MQREGYTAREEKRERYAVGGKNREKNTVERDTAYLKKVSKLN